MAEATAFDPKKFEEAVGEKTNARLKMWLEICAHCGLCADTCHFYLANDKDPKMIPAVKGKKVLEAFKKKGKIDEKFLEDFYWTVYGECTMCRRCTMFCPFGIDIATITSTGRGLCVSQGKVPENLVKTIESYYKHGNQMEVTEEDWIDTPGGTSRGHHSHRQKGCQSPLHGQRQGA
jgi:Fe-S oxidoreductase